MKLEQKMYQRRLSPKELSQRRIMVLKNWLEYFPPLNKPFEIKYDSKLLKVILKAEDCDCRGKNEPHQHYYIYFNGEKDLPFFKPNGPISITRFSENEFLLI